MTLITYLLAFIVAIGILVAVHEYGHFWMARRMGIRVLRFSIGFGKVLWSRTGSDGTEYALSAIPLGGYVKLLDEREGPVPATHAREAYNRKPVWQRILVLLAGPFANFLFAVAAYWVLFAVGVPGLKPVLGEIAPRSVADRAGLRSGEQIVAVGGHEVATREAVVLAILDEVMGSGAIDLRLREPASGAERTARLDVSGRQHALTEPGALMPGLGFDFWYPVIPARIGVVVAGGAAERAGLRIGDRIVAVDGRAVADFPSLVKAVHPNPGKRLVFSIERGGSTLQVPIEVGTEHEGERLVGRIGIQPAGELAIPEDMRSRERYGPLSAVAQAVAKTWDMSSLTLRMIWNVVSGDVSARNISGPLNIAEYAGFSARQGILSFLSFLAVVSVSLFVLNLLPIPILDGGQIVYQAAEWMKGSPVSERAQAVGQQVGILLMLVLMSFAFYNDLSRLFS